MLFYPTPISAAFFLSPGGNTGPGYVLQLFANNHKTANDLTTSEAIVKLCTYFESFEFFYVGFTKFKGSQILLKIIHLFLATIMPSAL